MSHDVYVFGDSHWRVFFPFVNHGAATDNVSHTQDGITTIDTIANELSGATMYGLLKDNSRIGARARILNTIDKLGGVDNVGLVFGEVDARFHNGRYFNGDRASNGRILETVARYVRFVEEDLLHTKRVRGGVFIYHGFSYPQGEFTLLQPSQPIGERVYHARVVNAMMGNAISDAFQYQQQVCVIDPYVPPEWVSADGVHLIPEHVYPTVLRKMKEALL